MNITLSPKLKSVLSSKTFIAIFFMLIGVGTTVLAHNVSKEKEPAQLSEAFPTWPDRMDEDFAHHDPFFGDEIFADMHRMHRHMNEMFARHHHHMQKLLTQKPIHNNKTRTKVSKRQDDKGYYYALNFDGYDKDDILVSVKDNAITFKAKKENKKEEKNSEYYAKSDFYYSFALPQDVEGKEPKIVRKDDEVVVTFLK